MIIRDKAVFFPEGRFTPVTGNTVYFSATDFSGSGQGTLTETTVFTTGVWLRSSGVASVAVYPLGDIDPSSIRAGDDGEVLTSQAGEAGWDEGGGGDDPSWLTPDPWDEGDGSVNGKCAGPEGGTVGGTNFRWRVKNGLLEMAGSLSVTTFSGPVMLFLPLPTTTTTTTTTAAFGDSVQKIAVTGDTVGLTSPEEDVSRTYLFGHAVPLVYED